MSAHVRNIHGRNKVARLYAAMVATPEHWWTPPEIWNLFGVSNPSGAISEIRQQTTLDDASEYAVERAAYGRDMNYYRIVRKADAARAAI